MADPVNVQLSIDQDFDKAFGEAAEEAERSEVALAVPASAAPAPVASAPAAPAPVASAPAAPAPVAAPAAAAPASVAAPTTPAPVAAPASVAAPAAAAVLPPAALEVPAAPAPVAALEGSAALAPAAPVSPAPAASPTPVSPVPVASETEAQKQARLEFEASVAPYSLSEAEQAALNKWKIDFPQEAMGLEAKFKSIDHDINSRVYNAVKAIIAHVDTRLTPVEQSTEHLDQQQHAMAVHTAHRDFDQIVEQIPVWIKTQPLLVQPALQSAFDNGDTNAVIELANMYKKDKGIALVTLETPAAPAAPVAPVVPSGADGLLPVSSRRAIPTPRGTPDPFDYETAFKEAADAAG